MNAKQRKLKKLAIILLAVIAILAISIPVFAATNGDAATTTATAETAVEAAATTADSATGLKALASAIAVGIAAAGGAVGMGLSAGKAVEGSRRLKARSVPPSCSASSLSRRLSFMPCSLLSSSSSSCKGECRS